MKKFLHFFGIHDYEFVKIQYMPNYFSFPPVRYVYKCKICGKIKYRYVDKQIDDSLAYQFDWKDLE